MLTEYAILICVVALPVCAAFVAVGRMLAARFYLQQLVLTFPVP